MRLDIFIAICRVIPWPPESLRLAASLAIRGYL